MKSVTMYIREWYRNQEHVTPKGVVSANKDASFFQISEILRLSYILNLSVIPLRALISFLRKIKENLLSIKIVVTQINSLSKLFDIGSIILHVDGYKPLGQRIEYIYLLLVRMQLRMQRLKGKKGISLLGLPCFSIKINQIFNDSSSN